MNLYKRNISQEAAGRYLRDILPPVFWSTLSILLLLLIFSFFNLSGSIDTLVALQEAVANIAGWFLVLLVNIILGVVVYLALGKYRKIRIGGATALPDFTYWGWFSMLFSAGMGIGLVFWSVAEPVLHYMSPPLGEGGTLESARLSMGITLLHWGVHAWGIYALLGLALAFFAFNRGLPLTVRSAFFPLLGDKIHGPVGYGIDTLASVATIFGLVTSLGLGVQQINAGLSFIFNFPETLVVQVLLIMTITAVTLLSVVLGLDRGIRRLSQLNITLAGALLVFVTIGGPTLFLFNAFVENIGLYLYYLPQISFWTEAYTGTNWQNDWTIFYWAWWIAWSPFVGSFIARISRGRTIQEFVIGVVSVPFLMTLLWLTVFGNSALYEELFSSGGLGDAIIENSAFGLFSLLDRYPFAEFTSILAVFLIVVFFITSADSGAYVLGMIAAGGKETPSVALRVLWAVLVSILAAIFLVGGGLLALRTASILTGLPFAIVLVVLSISLLKGMHLELQATEKNTS